METSVDRPTHTDCDPRKTEVEELHSYLDRLDHGGRIPEYVVQQIRERLENIIHSGYVTLELIEATACLSKNGEHEAIKEICEDALCELTVLKKLPRSDVRRTGAEDGNSTEIELKGVRKRRANTALRNQDLRKTILELEKCYVYPWTRKNLTSAIGILDRQEKKQCFILEYERADSKESMGYGLFVVQKDLEINPITEIEREIERIFTIRLAVRRTLSRGQQLEVFEGILNAAVNEFVLKEDAEKSKMLLAYESLEPDICDLYRRAKFLPERMNHAFLEDLIQFTYRADTPVLQ